MSNCLVPISIGELYDKYTILQIKKEKIQDKIKLDFINLELNYLKVYVDKYNLDINMVQLMRNINEQLWEIEDKIREKENHKEFDEEFILLARSVYKTNDERSIIKNKINNLLNSDIKDIKSYVNYN